MLDETNKDISSLFVAAKMQVSIFLIVLIFELIFFSKIFSIPSGY